MRKQSPWVQIDHDQVHIKHRGHWIDLLVYPICQRLWDEGIETFYSCQGGPTGIRLRDGRVFRTRAYLVVFEKDAKKVCKILKRRNPKVDKVHKKSKHKDRVAIRFDASYQAKNMSVALNSRRNF